MDTLIIPQGYVLVPEKWADRYFSKTVWQEIQEPTISQVAEYIGISVSKIKKDFSKIGENNCPLFRTYKGGKGKGNEMKFLKGSVELYKQWLVSRQ